MPKADCIAVLAPETCAYIAGLIDGEGTITLTREHRGGNFDCLHASLRMKQERIRFGWLAAELRGRL